MNTNVTPSPPKRCVIFDNSGTFEDITALLLLLTMKDVELLGIVVTPMDNYMKPATELTLKVLSIMGKSVEVSQSDFKTSHVNLADHFIGTTVSCNNFPMLIYQKFDGGLVSKQRPVEFMASKIRESAQKVTLNVTGPLYNIARLFESDPSIKDNIEEIILMGGAIDVEGNVYRKGTKLTHADWNMYWDPVSAKSVISSGVKITMFTLDGNYHVPIKHEMLRKIARLKSSNLSKMIGTFYCQYEVKQSALKHTYYFLDTVSVAHLAIPNLAEFEYVEIDVVTEGAEAGRTIRKPGSGHWVSFTKKVNSQKFYEFFYNSLQINGNFEENE